MLAGAVALLACVRVYDDKSEHTDAGHDAASVAPSACDTKYGGFPFAQDAANDLVKYLLDDCRISRHFAAIPPSRLPHLRECLALQIASVLQCSRDGVRVKYPAVDSQGVLCRDMKTAHIGNGFTSQDFDAFLEVVKDVLEDAKVDDDDITHVLGVLGNPYTEKDIVESSAPGFSKPLPGCDAGQSDDAGADTGGDANWYPPY
jgi:hypothetical protein